MIASERESAEPVTRQDYSGGPKHGAHDRVCEICARVHSPYTGHHRDEGAHHGNETTQNNLSQAVPFKKIARLVNIVFFQQPRIPAVNIVGPAVRPPQ